MAGRWVLDGGSDQGVRLLGPWGSGGSGGAFCGRVPVGGLFEDSGGWSLVTDAAHERSRTSTSFPIRF